MLTHTPERLLIARAWAQQPEILTGTLTHWVPTRGQAKLGYLHRQAAHHVVWLKFLKIEKAIVNMYQLVGRQPATMQ
jgi:hypothetical protein